MLPKPREIRLDVYEFGIDGETAAPDTDKSHARYARVILEEVLE
jgi:hypothetical protein